MLPTRRINTQGDITYNIVHKTHSHVCTSSLLCYRLVFGTILFEEGHALIPRLEEMGYRLFFGITLFKGDHALVPSLEKMAVKMRA